MVMDNTPVVRRVPSGGGAAPFVDLEMEAEFVRACLQKPGFAQRVLDRVPSEVFTNEVHQWVTTQVRTLIRKNRGRLSRVPIDVLKHQASLIQEAAKRDMYLRALGNLYSKPVEYEAYAENVIREYAGYQALTSGIRSALGGFNEHRDVQKVLGSLDEAARKSRSIMSDVEIYDYVQNWRDREQGRAFKTEIPVNNVCLKFGIPKMDAQIRAVPGTVHGFIAPFKRYKSIVLNHLGKASCLQGYNTLHVTLENTVELTADRYDASFAQIDFKRLTEQARSPDEREHIEKMFSRMERWPQRIKIIAAPANETSVMDIAAQIDHLELSEGFSPEVLILDYGNIFKPSIPVQDGQERKEQTQIVWDMQHVAKRSRTQRIVITAFQSNSDGIEAARLKQNQIGKSIGIAQALEGAIAINQNEQEKPLGIITLSPMFLRYGPILHSDVTLDSDFTRMCIDKDSDRLLWSEVNEWEASDG